MTRIVFLKDEGLGRTGVSGGCSEDLVLCRVGSVGELVGVRLVNILTNLLSSVFVFLSSALMSTNQLSLVSQE